MPASKLSTRWLLSCLSTANKRAVCRSFIHHVLRATQKVPTMDLRSTYRALCRGTASIPPRRGCRPRVTDEGTTSDLLSSPHVVAVADDAVFQVSFIPDGRSREQDAPLDGGSRPYPAAAPHRGVPDQGNVPPDNGVLSDHYPPFEGGRRMETSVTFHPKTLLQPLSRYPQPDFPRERIPLGRS